MDSIACNVVLLPSQAISASAIAFSEMFRGSSLFCLEDGKFFPHLSLYMVQLKIDDLAQVAEKLQALAREKQVISLTPQSYSQSYGYLGVEYAAPTQLVTLQQTVIASINPLRHGLRENDKQRLASTYGLVRHNLDRYGYRSVGELFHPHITITRFKEESPIVTDSFPDLNYFAGDMDGLGLFEMGDNGTCVRKIATFGLQA